MKASVKIWFNHLATRRSSGTAYHYKMHVTNFLIWLEDKPVEPCTIEDYVTHVLARSTKATANNHIAALKSFFAWYAPRNHLPDPTVEIKMFPKCEIKPRRQRFLTEKEYAAVLLVAENGIGRDTIEFLANTGLRRAEYCKLNGQLLDENGTHLLVKSGKGNKDRKVPVNAKVREIIDRNRHPNGTLLCVTYWKNANDIWCWCQSLARRAEIPAFGPHALRHYFATALIRRGVPLKLVSLILGHASVTMTEQIYCHLVPTDTTGATDCLNG